MRFILPKDKERRRNKSLWMAAYYKRNRKFILERLKQEYIKNKII